MRANRAIVARCVVRLVFVCFVLVCGQSRVQAATFTARDIAAVTQAVRAMEAVRGVTPLQAATDESALIICLFTGAGASNPDMKGALIACGTSVFGNNLDAYGYAEEVFQDYWDARIALPGQWTVLNSYPGMGTSSGSMTVDANNVGTLSAGGGTATLTFAVVAHAPPTAAFGYTTSQGDRGSGALVMSDDGCLMYGAYHSNADTKTLGHLYLARC